MNISPEQNRSLEQAALDTAETDLTDFQNFLAARGKSANTCRAYHYAVRQFLELYHTASHENMMLYKCYLMEHYKPQTVNLRIRALNCYMEFHRLDNSKMPMVRVQQRIFLENVISPADYEYLKRCLLRDGNLSYYYMVRMMAATGMRISELVQVKVRDVKRGYLDLYSKGNKSRRIYIPKKLREPCLSWLAEIGRTSGHVFLNRYGDPITPAGIRGQLKKFALVYNLNPSVLHPHSFRHLFAKNFISRCGDIAMLSDILGHESIETTRIYLRRSSTEQQEIVNQVVNW